MVPRFNKYIDVLIKKGRLAGTYLENPVGREGLGIHYHNCCAKIMSSKGTVYTKYLLIAP